MNQQLLVRMAAFVVAAYLGWSVLASTGGDTGGAKGPTKWPLPPPSVLPAEIDITGLGDPFPLPRKVPVGGDTDDGEPVGDGSSGTSPSLSRASGDTGGLELDPTRPRKTRHGTPGVRRQAPPLPLVDLDLPGMQLVAIARVDGSPMGVVLDEVEHRDLFLRVGDSFRVGDDLAGGYVAAIGPDGLRVHSGNAVGMLELADETAPEVEPPAESKPAVPELRLEHVLQADEPTSGGAGSALGMLSSLPGIGTYVQALTGAGGLDTGATGDAGLDARVTGASLGLPELLPDDIVIAIDGAVVATPQEARRILGAAAVGAAVSVVVMRDGKPVTLSVRRR